MLKIVAADLGLHCLPIIQQFLDTSVGSQTDLFKVIMVVKVSQHLGVAPNIRHFFQAKRTYMLRHF